MSHSTLNSNNKNKDTEAFKSKLYVKNMVCLKDQESVRSVLNKQGLNYSISVYGAIEFLEDITAVQHYEFENRLSQSGLDLLGEKECMLIDRIINTIIEVVHYADALPKMSFSEIINKYISFEDESILEFFTDVHGMSVLQFAVIQKIERAKELMVYEDMPLEEIADMLNYKNKDSLIDQVKEITGLTPSYFIRLKKERNKIAEESINSSHSGAASVRS